MLKWAYTYLKIQWFSEVLRVETTTTQPEEVDESFPTVVSSPHAPQPPGPIVVREKHIFSARMWKGCRNDTQTFRRN